MYVYKKLHLTIVIAYVRQPMFQTRWKLKDRCLNLEAKTVIRYYVTQIIILVILTV